MLFNKKIILALCTLIYSYIIRDVICSSGGINDCRALYIPINDVTLDGGNSYRMIPLQFQSGRTLVARNDITSTYTPKIISNRIHLTSTTSYSIGGFICDYKYRKSSIPIRNNNRKLIGYLFTQPKMRKIYNNATFNEFYEFILKKFKKKGTTNYFPKQTRYQAICISGDNNYGRYACYGLDDHKQTLPYLVLPYKLYSDSGNYITVSESEINWGDSYILENKRCCKAPGPMYCYKYTDWLGRVSYPGIIFNVDDLFYETWRQHTGSSVENALGLKENMGYDRRPDCS